MFTFHWSELLVVVISGLILLLGLALVMLRRRNEIMQVFLTPDDSHIEEDFFRIREAEQKEPPTDTEKESSDVEKPEGVENVPEENTAQWGTEMPK